MSKISDPSSKVADVLKPSRFQRQKRRDKRLHEELIECYRYKGWWTVKKRKGYDRWFVGSAFEYARQKEGIRLRSGFTNAQTDNLAPLKRMLEKNVGKSWDRVYSKLCQQMDKNSVIGQHLFDHLMDFVEVKILEIEGQLYGTGSLGKPRLLKANPWYVQYYVDPRTGILKKIERIGKRKKNKDHGSK